MNMNRQFEQIKKATLPIYDMCCQQGMSSNTGMSKLCYVRCYSEGLKTDSRDGKNYDFLMPQEVEII